jgi:hypothetical protein
VQLEAEALARIEAAVAERVAEAMASPAFTERVAARLKEVREGLGGGLRRRRGLHGALVASRSSGGRRQMGDAAGRCYN